MENTNLEQRASMKGKVIDALSEGTRDLIMFGATLYGTKLGIDMMSHAINKSMPIVAYASLVPTILCGSMSVYCGLWAVKNFKENIKGQ